MFHYQLEHYHSGLVVNCYIWQYSYDIQIKLIIVEHDLRNQLAHSQSQSQQVPLYDGEAYLNFVKHISNPITLVNYVSRFKKFVDYCQVLNIDSLMYNGDTKKIQTMITDFLIHIQGQGFSSATVAHHRTTVKFFYEMNDVTDLNWKKIAKVIKPFRKKANDRPYTTAEIAKMLEKVDQRGRIVILLMCSTGMREGAIHSIKIAHLQKLQDIYKSLYTKMNQTNISHSVHLNVLKQ
jgi:site-specific recombinase XerC